MIIIMVMSAGMPLPAQEEVQAQEEVSVVNIEVPVRVFYKGKAVDHLTKGDFTLYDGKKKQEVHGFYKVTRKIKLKDVDTAAGPDTELSLPSRYFVLVFRVTQYNDKLKEGLDYVFKNILVKNDRLLIFANDKTLLFNDLLDKEQVHALVDQTLREQSARSRNLLTGYLIKIKQLLDNFRLRLGVRSGVEIISTENGVHIHNFLTKYLLLWKEYKDRYLVPDMDKYYNFAKFLEKIRAEKWVISFYQVEIFPKLQLSGDLRRSIDLTIDSWLMGRSEDIANARKLSAKINRVDRELSAAENFPAEDISKLFYKVGATFHSVLMRVSKETDVADLEYKGISTDIENSLRDITAKTGGELMATNDLESALSKVIEKEDICYMLTYAPDNPGKTGKISVELNRKEYRKYEVIYDKNMREDYIRAYLTRKSAENPTVELRDVTFRKNTLSFTVGDFLLKEKGKARSGQLSIHILIKNKGNEPVYDKSNRIEAREETIALSLGFDWLQKGEYSIIMEIRDLLTGKSASHFLQPTIK